MNRGETGLHSFCSFGVFNYHSHMEITRIADAALFFSRFGLVVFLVYF